MFETDRALDLLRRLEGEPMPAMVADQPGIFLRMLYEQWRRQGGQLNGKPRHSVRHLRELIGREHEIKSLTPKLSGQTRLKRNDAYALLKTMLSCWSLIQESPTYDISSKAYQAFPFNDLESTVEHIVNSIFTNHEFARKGILVGEKREPSRIRYQKISNRNDANEYEKPESLVLKINHGLIELEIPENSSWRINAHEKFPDIVEIIEPRIDNTISSMNEISDVMGSLVKLQIAAVLKQAMSEIKNPLVNKEYIEDKIDFLSRVRFSVLDALKGDYCSTEKVSGFLANIEEVLRLFSEFMRKIFFEERAFQR